MKQIVTIKVDVWIICAILLLSNIITIGFWHPWTASVKDDRQIAVTGTSTIESEPDQYVFNPYYQKSGTDKAALNAELGSLSEEIVAKIKALGVADSAIKTSAYNYDYYVPEKTDDTITVTLYITITLKDRALAQSVQDYLATTDYSGSITPESNFSKAKQIILEEQARKEAIKDAKEKAEASAKQLGVTLGDVNTVSDLRTSGITPFYWANTASDDAVSSPSSIEGSKSSYSIQPGLNEYSFSIEVTYDLR